MDQRHFERITRVIAAMPSRRDVLRGLAAAGLGLGSARLVEVTDARKKRKRKKKRKPAQPNEYGCLEVGDPCQSADQCCSGICEGKKGKRTCRAHDSGDCAAGEQLPGCGGTIVACTTSFGLSGLCSTTTGNAGFCAARGDCFACQTDSDCQEADGGVFGPHAACVRCTGCAAIGGTACAAPDDPITMGQQGHHGEGSLVRV